MAAQKSNCLLCGVEYEVCKLCTQVKRYYPWKIDFDSPRHFQIYAIVKDVRAGALTNEEAKERLDKLGVDADEVAGFVQSVQDTLKPIVGAPEPKVKVQAEPVQAAAEPQVEENTEETKLVRPFRSRKK